MKSRVDLDMKQAKAAFKELARRSEDMTPKLEEIGEYLVNSMKQRLGRTQTAPDGSAWAPNSPVTLSRKSGTRPLWNTGTLARQIDANAGPRRILWGTNMVYGAVQQFGAAKGSFGAYSGVDKNGRKYSGVAPWGNIPARPFIGISNTDRAHIIAALQEWLEDAT